MTFLDFKAYMESCGYNPKSVTRRMQYLKAFEEYIQETGLKDIRDVTREDVLTFLFWLDLRISPRTKKPYSPATKEGTLSTLKLLFQSLYLQEKIHRRDGNLVGIHRFSDGTWPQGSGHL
jgi:site-specific recombinase XerD